MTEIRLDSLHIDGIKKMPANPNLLGFNFFIISLSFPLLLTFDARQWNLCACAVAAEYGKN